MGHLVNPTAFRLHYYKDWIDTWFVSTFTGYATILHTTRRSKRYLAYFMETMITDRFSVLYSHMVVFESNYRTVGIRLYFYDGFTEMRIQRLIYSVRKFNWRRDKLALNVSRRFRNLFNLKTQQRYLLRWGFYTFFMYRKAFFFLFFLVNYLGDVMAERTKKIIHHCFFSSFSVYWEQGALWIDRLWDKTGLWPNYRMPDYYYEKPIITEEEEDEEEEFENDEKKFNSLLIAKFYCQYLWHLLRNVILSEPKLCLRNTKATFGLFFLLLDYTYNFCVSRFSTLLHLFFTMRVVLKTKFFYFMRLMVQMDYFILLFAILLLRVYLGNYRQRIFFKIYYRILKPLVKKQVSLTVTLEFYGMDNDAICCQFLTRYLARKIEMKFTIRELYNPISKDLKILMYKCRLLFGFKMQFVGRITRRDRARISWVLFGSVPFSTVSAYIEHAMYIGILRNGTCCLRAWIFRRKPKYNYNYLHTYVISQRILRNTLLARKTNWSRFRTLKGGVKKIRYKPSKLPLV